MIRKIGFIFALFLVPIFLPVASANFPPEIHTLSNYKFKTPPGLIDQVNFWKKIYSEYTTQHVVIHDMNDLGIVYEVVHLGKTHLSRRSKEKKLDKIKAKYKRMLRRIARTKNKSKLKGEELRVYHLVKKNHYKASRRIRGQWGLKDRFKEGIERSGLYMDEIKRILRKYNLPEELSVLPHVESSFQLRAYSSAGAAGIWQFTRSTGRLFMRVGYDVDERRDPILATYGAAKLLKKNYEVVGSWPLAITAYNHGLRGMQRAKKRHGTNIVKIIENYRSRTFGFASRNFYPEFLAALDVVKNQNKYFPSLKIKNPLRRATFRLPNYINISTAVNYFNMTREEIAESNPSLRRPVLVGEKRIPKGYVFQAPASKIKDLRSNYNKIPKKALYSRQLRSKFYTVRRGDTLSALALRFGTSVSSLRAYNTIGRGNRIYIGQVLQLPKGKSKPSFRYANYTPENYTLVSYRIRKNDNLSKIAKRFNTNTRYLAKINRIKNPNALYPGQRIKIPQSGPPIRVAKLEIKKKRKQVDYYWVKKNDNLSKIAKRFDTNVTNLKSLNRMRNPNSLYPGQKLRIANRLPNPVKTKQKNQLNTKLPEDRIIIGNTSPGHQKGIESDEVVLNNNLKVIGSKKTNGSLNKNRPAFMPVSFSTQNHQKIGTISVDFDETLSHYAEWALMSVGELKKINKIKGKAEITFHDKIRVSFKKTGADKFEEKRQEYHKAIQEDFFNNYEIRKLAKRVVEKGDTLWEICNEIYTIPLWLLSSYNADKDMRSLTVGESIVIPVISPKTG